jgi:hypothetical protein
MFIPLSNAAMAEDNCSFVQLPFFLLFSDLLTFDCLHASGDASTGVVGVVLKLPLFPWGGWSMPVISSISELPAPTPIVVNLPAFLWGCRWWVKFH